MTKQSLLFTYLDSINWSKKNLLLNKDSEEAQRFKKEYVPFVINNFLGGTIDTVSVANIANTSPKMDARRQYAFLLGTVPQRRRFVRWPKKENNEMLDRVCLYYGVSEKVGRQYLPLHKKEDLEMIKNATEEFFKKKQQKAPLG